MPRIKDLSNKRFGRLIALKDIGRRRGLVVWECKCDCGNITDAVSVDLLRGHSQSCGCFKMERIIEMASIKNRIDPGEASCNSAFRIYKRTAKKRKLDFELSRDEFKSITSQDCFYCKSPPSQIAYNGKSYNGIYIYNGIDRIDNSKGYARENCVPCCKHCNWAKSVLSLDEFKSLIIAIYDNLPNWYLQEDDVKCRE